MNDDMKWARLAMLMDTSGCFSIKKQREGDGFAYACTIIITNTNRKLIEYARREIGYGNIYTNTPTNANDKAVHRYVANGVQAALVAKNVLQWLIAKKEQATLLLEFPVASQGIQNTTDIQEKRRELYERMSSLNTRGNFKENGI